VNWSHVAQDRDWRQASVNTAVNLWIHKRRGISCPADECQLLKKGSAS
jgi:hypothetical protein